MTLILPVLRVLPETEMLMEMSARLALTLLGALLLQQLAFLLVGRIEHWMTRVGRGEPAASKRAHTLAQMFRNLASGLVWSGAVLHGLAVLGWDVRPLLAGAGILGVALGFGAQTLVRDWIAGFFVLVENQYGVGDLVEVNGTPATVEEVTLRHTRLRDLNGYVYYVPNGELKVVVNRSRDWTRQFVDVSIAADEDAAHALAVCRGAVASMNEDPHWRERLLDPIEIWGVESLIGEDVPLRMALRARPGPDAFQAARELRRRCQMALTGAGVRTRTRRGMVVAPEPEAPGRTPAPDQQETP